MEVKPMNTPERTFQYGACRAAIFANRVNVKGRDVIIKKAIVSKRYKDREGQWRSSSGLDTNDIPKMIMTLIAAYMYLTKSNGEKGNGSASGIAEDVLLQTTSS